MQHIISCLLYILTQDGYTALILASNKGRKGVVKFLIEMGAEIEAKTNVR